MAKSIIQTEKECYICRELYNVENTGRLDEHHIYFGTANRAQSEKYGMKVWLCLGHHTGTNDSVHKNRTADLFLKCRAQEIFEEKIGTRDDFREIFGKSYL